MGRVIRGQRKGPGGIFKVRQQAKHQNARVCARARGKGGTNGGEFADVPSIFKPAAWEAGSSHQDERGGGSTPGHARTTRCPRALDELSRRANKQGAREARRKHREDGVLVGEPGGGSSWGDTLLRWWLCCDGFCADAVLRMRVPTR